MQKRSLIKFLTENEEHLEKLIQLIIENKFVGHFLRYRANPQFSQSNISSDSREELLRDVSNLLEDPGHKNIENLSLSFHKNPPKRK